MNGAPVWARILYSLIVVWVGFVLSRNIVPAMWNHTSGSWQKRLLAVLGIIFLIVFFGLVLYCTVTGRITATRHRG